MGSASWTFVVLLCVAGGCSRSLATSIATCKNDCSIDDSNPDCWNVTLSYFTQNLQVAIQNYVGVILHMDVWKVRSEEHRSTLASTVKDMEIAAIINVINKYNSSDKGTELGPLRDSELQEILLDILTKVRGHTSAFDHPVKQPPRFHCPIPCSYPATVFESLFYVTLVCFLLLVLIGIIYVWRTSCRIDKGYQRQHSQESAVKVKSPGTFWGAAIFR